MIKIKKLEIAIIKKIRLFIYRYMIKQVAPDNQIHFLETETVKKPEALFNVIQILCNTSMHVYTNSGCHCIKASIT